MATQYQAHTWIHEEIIKKEGLNHMELGIQTVASELSAEENARVQDVNLEETRAKGIEAGLRSDLNNEVTRATGIEGGLRTDITALQGRTTTAENNITNLQSRMTTVETEKIDANEKGAALGVAELDANGLVPSTQLPSYVDDVIEGYYNDNDGKFYEESTYVTEIVGETGKIYVDLATDKQYRWSGSMFVPISNSPTVFSDTLTAGNTTITFTDGKIAAANFISLYTSTGVAPLSQTISGSTYTAVFEVQSADMDVVIEVK